jgi:hypothetical protein
MRRLPTIFALPLVMAISSPLLAAEPTHKSAPEAPEPLPERADSLNASGPWRLEGTLSLTATQSGYSANWHGGDHGSWVWVSRFDGTAERQVNRHFNTLTNLTLAYGQASRQQDDPNDPSRLVWEVPAATDDQITLETVARFAFGRFTQPYVAYRTDTQFFDASEPNGKLPFNPVGMKLSTGLAKVLAAGGELEVITRAGVGVRLAVGRGFTELPPSRSTERFEKTDTGLEWVTTAVVPMFSGRGRYRGRLGVFFTLTDSQADALRRYDAIAASVDPAHQPVADYWRSPDVNLENVFSAGITRYLGVEFTTQWIYNKLYPEVDVDPRLDPEVLIPQVESNVHRAGWFREALAVTLSYRAF